MAFKMLISSMILLNVVNAGPKKKEALMIQNKIQAMTTLGRSEKVKIKHEFKNCGNFSTDTGILESLHPYEPLTACRWFIKSAPGSRLEIKLLKMDIEEEDPSDSPYCNEREGDELPSCKSSNLKPEECEWDYLQVKTPYQTFEKLCNYVEKDGNYFEGQEGYNFDQYFTDYSYSDSNNVVANGWYDGRQFYSNVVIIDFATDNLAQFYGFKLSWNVWSVNPCKTAANDCHENARCFESSNSNNTGSDAFKCVCMKGYEGDGKECRPQNKMLDEDQAASRPLHAATVVQESGWTGVNEDGIGGDFVEKTIDSQLMNSAANSAPEFDQSGASQSGPGEDESKYAVSNYYVALEAELQRKTTKIVSSRVSLKKKKRNLTGGFKN